MYKIKILSYIEKNLMISNRIVTYDFQTTEHFPLKWGYQSACKQHEFLTRHSDQCHLCGVTSRGQDWTPPGSLSVCMRINAEMNSRAEIALSVPSCWVTPHSLMQCWYQLTSQVGNTRYLIYSYSHPEKKLRDLSIDSSVCLHGCWFS